MSSKDEIEEFIVCVPPLDDKKNRALYASVLSSLSDCSSTYVNRILKGYKDHAVDFGQTLNEVLSQERESRYEDVFDNQFVSCAWSLINHARYDMDAKNPYKNLRLFTAANSRYSHFELDGKRINKFVEGAKRIIDHDPLIVAIALFFIKLHMRTGEPVDELVLKYVNNAYPDRIDNDVDLFVSIALKGNDDDLLALSPDDMPGIDEYCVNNSIIRDVVLLAIKQLHKQAEHLTKATTEPETAI
jgi:hypothetical protein